MIRCENRPRTRRRIDEYGPAFVDGSHANTNTAGNSNFTGKSRARRGRRPSTKGGRINECRAGARRTGFRRTGFPARRGRRPSTNGERINECRADARSTGFRRTGFPARRGKMNQRMRRGYSFIRGPAFVDDSPSNTIPAGNDVFAEEMCHRDRSGCREMGSRTRRGLYPTAQFHSLYHAVNGDHVGGVAHIHLFFFCHFQHGMEGSGDFLIQTLQDFLF